MHISDVNQIAENLLHGESPSDRVNARFKMIRLEREMVEWKYRPDTPPALANLADAYRSSALLLLYQMWRRLSALGYEASRCPANEKDSLSEKIKNERTTIMMAIDSIPAGDPAESALLFPLFIAGSEVVDPQDCAKIRTRLQAALVRRQFRNITQALEVLEQIWHLRYTESDVSLDSRLIWRELLDSSDAKLLLT